MKAVVLNHTGFENHHGCRVVMRTIYDGLAARDIRVIAASPVRHKWERNKGLLRAISTADVIVINGEGTLHHGAGHGERLLRVVEHPARGNTPVVLINALYQDNPSEWGRYLERMALISVRDTQSRANLQDQGFEAFETPDFSMAGAEIEPPHRPVSVVVGFDDSVVPETTRALEQVYRAYAGPKRQVPIWSSLENWVFPETQALLYAANAPFLLAYAGRRFASEKGYLAALGQLGLFVTGRFHGAAMAIRTRTPFLAADSNSHKVEALLRDAGLNPNRRIDPKTLTDIDVAAWRFSEAEQLALELYLTRARAGAAFVFDRIAKLARGESQP